MHYEMRLDRQLTRAFRLLMQLQLMQNSRTEPVLKLENEIEENEPISPPPEKVHQSHPERTRGLSGIEG